MGAHQGDSERCWFFIHKAGPLQYPREVLPALLVPFSHLLTMYPQPPFPLSPRTPPTLTCCVSGLSNLPWVPLPARHLQKVTEPGTGRDRQ